LGFLFTRILQIPEAVKSFLSLPSIIIIPVLVGKILTFVISKKYTYLKNLNAFSHLILEWIFGILITTIIAIDLQYLEIFWLFYVLLTLLILIGVLFSLIENKWNLHFQTPRELSIYILVSSFIGIIPPIIASLFIPFPFFGMNHDQPKFLIQPVIRALEDSYLMMDTRVPEVLLSVVACGIFNVDPAAFAWSARFFISAIQATGTFLLIYRVFKNKDLALFTTLISSFLLSAGANPLGHLFFDIPAQHFKSSTILFSIFPSILLLAEEYISRRYGNWKLCVKHLFILFITMTTMYIYFRFSEVRFLGLPHYFKLVKWNPLIVPIFLLIGILISLSIIRRNKAEFFIIFSITLTFLLIHPDEAPLFMSIFYTYLMLNVLNKLKKVKFITRIVVVISMLYVGTAKYLEKFFAYQIEFISNIINSFIGLSISTWGIDFKIKDLLHGNNILFFTLFIFGSIFIFKSKMQSPEMRYLVLSWICLAVYMLPITWTYRIFKELNLFMAYVIAFLLLSLFDYIGRFRIRLLFIKKSKELRMDAYRLLMLSFLAVILILLLAQPLYYRFSYHCKYFPQKEMQTQITIEEWEAALWMRKNLPKNAILISDYFSMWILTPLSNKVWAAEKSMDPPEQVPGLLPQLQYIKHQIFQASSSESAYRAIINIKPIWVEEQYVNYIKGNAVEKNYTWIIVISKRTSEWVRLKDYYGFVWCWEKPEIDEKLVALFQNEHYFKIVYKNDFLYVITVNEEA